MHAYIPFTEKHGRAIRQVTIQEHAQEYINATTYTYFYEALQQTITIQVKSHAYHTTSNIKISATIQATNLSNTSKSSELKAASNCVNAVAAKNRDHKQKQAQTANS